MPRDFFYVIIGCGKRVSMSGRARANCRWRSVPSRSLTTSSLPCVRRDRARAMMMVVVVPMKMDGRTSGTQGLRTPRGCPAGFGQRGQRHTAPQWTSGTGRRVLRKRRTFWRCVRVCVVSACCFILSRFLDLFQRLGGWVKKKRVGVTCEGHAQLAYIPAFPLEWVGVRRKRIGDTLCSISGIVQFTRDVSRVVRTFQRFRVDRWRWSCRNHLIRDQG